ncbi:MAG: tRNA (N6-threonylcarbamoyladenosine(37)-N6)-methyltransferase TrmO [Nocardioides sp.]
MTDQSLTLRSVGVVRSDVRDPADAPRQGDEDECLAWVEIDPAYAEGLTGVEEGAELLVLTWLHLAERDVLVVHPRGDEARPLTGVFFTRSPGRPNPIGLHRVRVLARDGARLRVTGMEAVDGTPVVDLKAVLGGAGTAEAYPAGLATVAASAARARPGSRSR